MYENIVNEFKKRNCNLLTTEEEYNSIPKKSNNYKLNYVASCGHTHNVFYNVFKSRKTGIICSSCKNKENSLIIKEKIKNKEISKLYRIEQEFNFIQKFTADFNNEFEIIKAFDGCMVDIFYKPKNILDDEWVGIQVKTSKSRNLTYSFNLDNNLYTNCLLLLFCYEDESMWLIPENIIKTQSKLSIGYYKSKYNIYKIDKNEIINNLNKLYISSSKQNFNILNTPKNIYQKREQEYRNFREEKINFLSFSYEGMEGTVYDFKINNLKIQEKVAKIKDNKCVITLSKNNSSRNKKQYDIGDNDYYWLNFDDKNTFFVIPEIKLYENGFIGNKDENKNKIFLKIKINNNKVNKKNKWLEEYMLYYNNIDKNKLLSILHLN